MIGNIGLRVLPLNRRMNGYLMGLGALILQGLTSGFAVAQVSSPLVAATPYPSEEMIDIFSRQTVFVEPGAPLTDNDRRALRDGVLTSSFSVRGIRSVYGLELVVDQHLTAEVSFAMPGGSLITVPPLTLTFAQKGGVLYVNNSLFATAAKSEQKDQPNTYVVKLRPGTNLIVRPLRGADEADLGGLVCLQLDYRRLEGAERLPAEEQQLPLLAEQAHFSLTGVAIVSHVSGIKPSVVRLSLQDISGIPQSIINADQGVGRNPSARLMYQPKGQSDTQMLQMNKGAFASSSVMSLLHTWTGEEFHTKVTDTVSVRRIAADETISKIVKSALRKRGIVPALECLFVKWERNKQIDRLMNKQSELHKLIRKAGG